MIHNYDILTSVEIRHEYFKSELINSTVWTPTNHTVRTLRNLGLSFKAANGRLRILASVEKTENGDTILDERLNNPFQLSFFIQFNQPYWSNFTPLSAKGNRIFCFHNGLGKDSLLLTQSGDKATKEDLVLKTGQSHYPLKAFEKEGIQIKKTGEDENIASYAIKEINNESFLESKVLDEGLYHIIDTQNKSESLFINRDKSNAEAICHLIFDKNRGDIIQADRSWQTKNFQINFSSLDSHWRYYFPLEKIQEYEGVRVLNGVREEVFDQGEIVAINGSNMIRFTSLKPIRMVQHGDQTFQLRRNVGVSNRSEGVIIDRLPQPQKQKLFRQDSQGNRYSDIYINL